MATTDPDLRRDVIAFYQRHNAAKLRLVDDILHEAAELGLSADYVIDALHERYSVPRNATQRMRWRQSDSASQSPPPDEEEQRRQAPALTHHHHGAPPIPTTTSTEHPPEPRPTLRASGSSAKAKADEVLSEQIRSWLLELLRPAPNTPEAQAEAERSTVAARALRQLESEANPLDALRDGVILRRLLLKLQNPKRISYPPMRSGGMFSYDNVAAFVRDVQELCDLRQHEVFHHTDLCDGKNDRSVVTCLLAVGRYALEVGLPAPGIARFDKEIEQQQQRTTEEDVEQAIHAAEAEAVAAAEVDDTDAIASDMEEERETAALVEQVLSDSEYESPARPSQQQQQQQQEHCSAGTSPAATSTSLTVSSPPSIAPVVAERTSNGRASDPPPRASPARDSGPVVRPPTREAAAWVQVPPPLQPTVPPPPIHPAVSPPSATQEASPKRYVSKRADAVDVHVGQTFNRLLATTKKAGRQLHGRIARTRNTGEYVIYHQITGKRTVVYVRELSNVLMVRVGGGWESFEQHLARRLVDYEVVPSGTTERRAREEARRRAQL